MTLLVQDASLMRLRSAIFILTKVNLHSREAWRDQLLIVKGNPFRKFSLRAPAFRYAPVLLRQAADSHLCYDRVIMHVVNKHVCVCMCAVTAMSSIQ